MQSNKVIVKINGQEMNSYGLNCRKKITRSVHFQLNFTTAHSHMTGPADGQVA